MQKILLKPKEEWGTRFRMKLSDYIWDRISCILINLAGLILLSGYLYITGYSKNGICIIDIIWIVVFCFWIGINYYNRSKYYKYIEDLLDQLDKRYLIAEVIKPSIHLEDKIYRDILRRSNKSVIEEIHGLQSNQEDYKDFIEAWIHDVKTPMTSISLLCENLKQVLEKDQMYTSENELDNMNCYNEVDDITTQITKIESELGKIENKVDIVLYYARMENAYNDYLIHKVQLKKAVIAAIQHNRAYFIQNNMKIDFEIPDTQVSTDEKWLVFILNQVFLNSIKYRKDNSGRIKIYVKEMNQCVNLYIEDDGIGIPKQDLGRIFEKGFTGSNGREDIKDISYSEIGNYVENRKSTGLGLYLCKKLCDKLSIGLSCESEQNEYTRIILTLPNSDFTKIEN